MPQHRLARLALLGAITAGGSIARASPPDGDRARLDAIGDASAVEFDGAYARTVERLRDEPGRRGSERWYGWQTLALDGALLTASSLYVFAGNGGRAGWWFPISGIALYALGGPAIHVARNRPLRGLESLGLRVGIPLAAAGLAVAWVGCDERGPMESEISFNDQNPCTGRNIAAGLAAFVGGLAAVIVDSAAIAREPLPQKASTAAWPTVVVVPWLDRQVKGAAIAVQF